MNWTYLISAEDSRQFGAGLLVFDVIVVFKGVSPEKLNPILKTILLQTNYMWLSVKVTIERFSNVHLLISL